MTNILVENSTGLIKHQAMDYTLYSNKVEVYDSGVLQFVFACHNSSDCTVYEISDAIADFVGNKFLYQDSEVVANPDYIAPGE